MGYWQNPGRVPKGTTKRYRGLDSIKAEIRTSDTCLSAATSSMCLRSLCPLSNKLVPVTRRELIKRLGKIGFVAHNKESIFCQIGLLSALKLIAATSLVVAQNLDYS